MTTTQTQTIARDDDEQRVWSWKLDWARTLPGFPEPLALVVANEDLDIHYIDELARRGCSPHLAVEIAR